MTRSISKRTKPRITSDSHANERRVFISIIDKIAFFPYNSGFVIGANAIFRRQEMRDILSHRQIFNAITALRQTGKQIFLLTTGSTGGLAEALWQPFHASNQLMGHHFCYAQEDLERFLGFKPKKFCSEETAAQMAAHAYWHGMELAVRRGIAVPDMIGVGMTSVVSSDRHHRGDERVCIAVRTKDSFRKFEATFEKCAIDASPEDRFLARLEQAQLADVMTLNVILSAACLNQISFPKKCARSVDFIDFGDDTTVDQLARAEWANRKDSMRMEVGAAGGWLKGCDEATDQRIEAALANPPIYGRVFWDGREESREPNLKTDLANAVLLPGSFNPLHYGHIALARTVEQMTGKRVVFEITNMHPDKGRIPDEEMMRRADQFQFFAPVLLSDNAPLFIDKARRFPGVPMVVGADVMQALLNAHYYGNNSQKMFSTLEEFRHLGTVFYVNGRKMNGKFLTRDDIYVPSGFEDLFIAVSGREDISSTQLRAKAQA